MTFTRALLALCLIAAAAAQAAKRVSHDHECDGFGKACTVELREGLLREVTFKLSEPIICPSQLVKETECVVVVNISNSHPEWIVINPCKLRWTADDWHQAKTVQVATVQDYVGANEDRQVHLATQVTGSLSELYQGYNPADIFVESKKQGSAQCRATGDPHYTTFDGKYWHYYDGNRRNPTRLTYYKSTVRDFVVQVQVRGNPAVACAIAGREGNDRVMINNCGGGMRVEADFHTEKVEDQPRIDVSGRTYTVYFKSGAWMRFDGGNAYLQSVDPGASCGLCGNFDGNPENDAPAYKVQDYNALFTCQKVCTKSVDGAGCACCDGPNCGEQRTCDIWEYSYTKPDEGTNKLPPAKKICPYEPTFLKPLIGAQDVEDITEFLKKHTEEEEERGVAVFDIDNFNFDPRTKYDAVLAKQACRTALDTDLVVECKLMPTAAGGSEFAEMDTAVIDDCTEDYINLGGPDYDKDCEADCPADELKLSVSTLEQSCIELYIRYGNKNCESDSCIRLKNVLCPQECSGNGECDDAACQCSTGWAGKACDVDTTAPAQITDVDDQYCDTQTGDCPEEVVISGVGFYCEKGCNDDTKDIGPQCRYEYPGDADKDWIVDAVFVGEGELLCPVPTGRHHADTQIGMYSGGTELVTKLSVRSDTANEWSTDKFDMTFFDSTCTICNRTTATCAANENTCQIDGICYKPNAQSQTVDPMIGAVNPCLKCDPKTAQDKFSYFTASNLCKPQFVEGQVYDHNIYGNLAAGDVEGLVIDATANFNVNQMPGYADGMTYAISNPGADALIAEWFDVNAETGQIILLKDVDIVELCQNLAHCAADPTKFNGFFRVEACDQNGECSSVAVVIELVSDVDVIPFFGNAKTGGYAATVSELATAGTVLTFTPPLKADAQFTDVKYTFFQSAVNMGGALAIDELTGVVTVADPSLLDYEKIDIANCLQFTGENAQITCELRRTYCAWVDEACTMKPTTWTVKGADEEGGTHTTKVYITVTNAPEPPSGIVLYDAAGDQAVGSLEENAPAGTMIGELRCLDPETGKAPTTLCTYALVGGSSDFEIEVNATTKTNYLVAKKQFNFEDGERSVTVSLTATDPAGQTSATIELAVAIVDVNEKPINLKLSVIAQGVEENGLELTISETMKVGTIIGSLSAEDPDAEKEDEPSCQLTSGSAFLEVNENKLTLLKALDFETDPTPKFSFACIDRPTTGLLSLVSDAVDYSIKVTDGNDAPQDLALDQKVDITEHAEPVVGQSIGQVTAIDADAGAGAFQMIVDDANTWELSAPVCAVSSGSMRCAADLILKKPLGSADASCTPPDNNGDISCTVFIDLIDGADASVSASPKPSVVVTVKDVQDDPTSIIVDIATVEEGQPKGATFGRVTVDDIDGSFGPNGRLGHVLTMTSTNNALGLQVVNSRRRATGAFEWQFIVEEDRALEKGINTVIELTFEVEDLKKAGTKFTFSHELRVVAEGAGDTGGNIGTIVGGVQLSKAEILFNFDEAGNEQVTVNGDNGNIAKVELVELLGAADGCATGTERSMSQAGLNFEAPGAGNLEMCEVTLLTNLEATSTIAAGNSEASVTVTTLPLDQVVRMHEHADVRYVKVTKTDADEIVYLQLMVTYKGPCFSNECDAAAEICLACDLGEGEGIACTADEIAGTAYKCTPKPAQDALADAVDAAQTKLNTATTAKNLACSDPESAACKAAEAAVKLAAEALEQAQADASTGATAEEEKSNTGVIVAVVVVLLILILGGVAFVLYRQQDQKVTGLRSRMRTYEDNSAVQSNRAFNDPAIQAFTAGQMNPLYDWYHPDMTRGQADVHFAPLGEGAFVVRDSQATPGWHMLCIKTGGQVLHDKIRQTDDGRYELLPTDGGAQPTFENLPELVDHYTAQQQGVGYVLKLGNDIRGDMNAVYGGDSTYAPNTGGADMYGGDSSYAPVKQLGGTDNPTYFANGASDEGSYADANSA